jgi:hypothetical protein
MAEKHGGNKAVQQNGRKETHYVLQRKKDADVRVAYEYAIVSNNMYLGKYSQTWQNYHVLGKFSYEVEINGYYDMANLVERLDSLGETATEEKDNLKNIKKIILEAKKNVRKQG